MSAAPHVSRAELVEKARRFPARSFTLFGAVLAVLGGAAFLWTLAVGEAGRAWQSWHVNFMFWTGLAQGMVVFAATQKLAKGHWSGLVIRLAEAGAAFLRMSLAHKWVSNLFGAFYFMGSFLAALMALALLAIAVRRRMGLGALISPKQLHDLGKLCFGFTVFWAYLMWAQFLVIWYGNLPEETFFIFYRLIGPWKPLGVWVFLLVFVVPFIGLLGVKPKQHPPTLATFALVSLAGSWLERYLEIVPSINGGQGPVIGVTEVGVTLFFAGLFFLSWAWFAGRCPILSPRLAAD